MGKFKKWVNLREQDDSQNEPRANGEQNNSQNPSGAYKTLVNASAFKKSTGREMQWNASWKNRRSVIKPVFDQLEYLSSPQHMGVLLRDVKRLIKEKGGEPEQVEVQPPPQGITEEEPAQTNPNNQFRTTGR